MIWTDLSDRSCKHTKFNTQFLLSSLFPILGISCDRSPVFTSCFDLPFSRADCAIFVDIPDCPSTQTDWARKHGGFGGRSLREKWCLLQGEIRKNDRQWKKCLKTYEKNYFPGICEEYSSGSSHSRPSTRVRMQSILAAARELHLLSLFIYNARFTNVFLLFRYSLSNSRRVPYEEVRLPPTSNQRCDLYVDDEVEVSSFTRKPVLVRESHVIKLQKVIFECIPFENPYLDCFHP